MLETLEFIQRHWAIVVAIGEGAKASLSAFDDRVRGVIG